MRLLPVSLALLALLALLAAAACSRAPKAQEIASRVKETWGTCPGVTPRDLEIVSTKGNTVRFKYTLHMDVDGAKIGVDACPASNRTLLEALANKDMADLKQGDDIPVEQEASR
ncbi:MAG: hypothetical protein ABJD97_17365 [Betaproteobacteria bacterium]